MHKIMFALIYILTIVSFPSAHTFADGTTISDSLHGNGVILMVRHSLAPGFGDPDTFSLRDCTTQRNLNDQGRLQAAAIGDWLRSRGFASARVFSSQWCRCLETAKLLKMGPVTELQALNSFYEFPENRESHLKALRGFISEQPDSGNLIIMVTHQVTISAMTDLYISSGEGVILKLKHDAPYDVVGRIDFAD